MSSTQEIFEGVNELNKFFLPPIKMIISCETSILIPFLSDVSYYNSAFLNPSMKVTYYLRGDLPC